MCLRCQKWTLCEHSALIASLFRADVEVPDNLVAETPALRKKCNKLRGTDSDWLGLTTRPGRPAVPLRNSEGVGSANLPPYLQNHTIVCTWGNRQTRYTWTLTQTGCY